MIKDRRFEHLEKKVGLLILLAVAGLVATVVFIGIEQDVFSKKYTLHFTVEKATGFSEGMPVKLSGFRVGRLKRLELSDEAKVDIQLQINQKYQKWIRDNSWAKLVKEGVIGESVIEVTVGNPKEPVLEDGDTIFYEPTASLDETVEEVKRELIPVLYQLKDLVGWLADPEGDVKVTLAHARSFTEGLANTRARLDELLSGVRGDVAEIRGKAVSLIEETENRVKEISPALENAGEVSGTLKTELPVILEKLELLLSDLNAVAKEVRSVVEESAGEVPGMVTTAGDALENGRDITESVKQIWPISSHLPGEPPQMVPPEGYEKTE